jgi:ribonuclease P protein component
MRFRPHQRLQRSGDFSTILRKGRRRDCGAFLLFSRRRDPAASVHPDPQVARFGVTASRKVGNAVVRNRLKRQMREIFRLNQAIFPLDADLLVTLRPGADQRSYAELQELFLRGCERNGLVSREKRIDPSPQSGVA